ncbi:hypothetical protein AC629_01900 [Bradyrhizobium sp. NAS80.1]|uniref:hypothetical protein n=1 Tax=Bradyrhizobium sp. NAS80.1 TaxID=1680159 RepID=UPI00096311CB|nr:hypothetical protein [Bradyrhizobium sp. NAS80.1]OKO91726.1 hypothetical protein AC629_01900 [Bradyrhizobium sp. NAS80.1]
MIWNSIVRYRGIAPRRRLAATTLVHGLSLAVRFTSATGEQVEIPAQSVQATNPVMSIMTRDGAQLPYDDWGPSTAQPIFLRRSWPSMPDCRGR